MKIIFLGAAREVTGSCYLVDTGNVRFLVDCGMVQGGRDAEARNSEPFAFDPKSIDFVLLSHAHIDHSGLLPSRTAMRSPCRSPRSRRWAMPMRLLPGITSSWWP